MKCERCGTPMVAGESREHDGKKLCRDCRRTPKPRQQVLLARF